MPIPFLIVLGALRMILFGFLVGCMDSWYRKENFWLELANVRGWRNNRGLMSYANCLLCTLIL